MVRERARHTCFFAFVGVVALTLSFSATGPAGLYAQPPRGQEIYQDFRGSRALTEEWKMIGKNREAVIKPEEEGLRITLAKAPQSSQPVGVRLLFPISGDFEITGGYQLLSADSPPAGGGGVGIAFNLGSADDNKKFVKFGRFVQAKERHTYIAECRLKDSPKDDQMKFIPTKARSGQLRLIREGSKLRYLVADDPPNVFREVHQGEFTTDDLELVRFAANNNGSPAGVDARIVDIKIQLGKPSARQASEPNLPAGQDAGAPSRGRLAAVLLVGFAITLLVVGVGLFLVIRLRRRPSEEPAAAQPTSSPLSVVCPGCGKNLKFKPESAGKKIKCSQCGKTVLTPAN